MWIDLVGVTTVSAETASRKRSGPTTLSLSAYGSRTTERRRDRELKESLEWRSKLHPFL